MRRLYNIAIFSWIWAICPIHAFENYWEGYLQTFHWEGGDYTFEVIERVPPSHGTYFAQWRHAFASELHETTLKKENLWRIEQFKSDLKRHGKSVEDYEHFLRELETSKSLIHSDIVLIVRKRVKTFEPDPKATIPQLYIDVMGEELAKQQFAMDNANIRKHGKNISQTILTFGLSKRVPPQQRRSLELLHGSGYLEMEKQWNLSFTPPHPTLLDSDTIDNIQIPTRIKQWVKRTNPSFYLGDTAVLQGFASDSKEGSKVMPLAFAFCFAKGIFSLGRRIYGNKKAFIGSESISGPAQFVISDFLLEAIGEKAELFYQHIGAFKTQHQREAHSLSGFEEFGRTPIFWMHASSEDFFEKVAKIFMSDPRFMEQIDSGMFKSPILKLVDSQTFRPLYQRLSEAPPQLQSAKTCAQALLEYAQQVQPNPSSP